MAVNRCTAGKYEISGKILCAITSVNFQHPLLSRCISYLTQNSAISQQFNNIISYTHITVKRQRFVLYHILSILAFNHFQCQQVTTYLKACYRCLILAQVKGTDKKLRMRQTGIAFVESEDSSNNEVTPLGLSFRRKSFGVSIWVSSFPL